MGGLIVEHEQGGRKRAAYGEAVLDDLSQRLTADFGKGFTTTNLKYMRLFYLAFRIRHALRDESAATEKVNALRLESAICHSARDESPVLRPEQSWTHYRLLLSVEDRTAREWYMQEAARIIGPAERSTGRYRCSITSGCWPAEEKRLFARRRARSWAKRSQSSSSGNSSIMSSAVFPRPRLAATRLKCLRRITLNP